MLKFKSLSLLLLALGSSTGAAYSAPTFNVSNIGFVQHLTSSLFCAII